MTFYDELINSVNPNETKPNIIKTETNFSEGKVAPTLFDIDTFVKNVVKKSAEKNKAMHFNSSMISAYDIAVECIRTTIFKILNYPVKDYVDAYLPLQFRAALGSAVHDYIQSNSGIFTELECSMRVPSKKLSCRLDALINDNVLVEIKSVPYSDYSKIVNSRSPKDDHFLQAILYRYLLNNHLAEIQNQQLKSESNPYGIRTLPPKLEKYNIQYIQLIYVAHDLISADCKSLSEALGYVDKVKKLLNSKYHKFFFITSLTLDLSCIDPSPYESYVISKLDAINNYLDNNIIPPKNDPFVNTQKCFFCLYKEICNQS